MAKTPEYFVDKTIVISGAGSGIGRATAQIFAREGANVVCGDIDVNAKSIYYSMQAVLPHMLEQGGGVIVNVASMSHKRGAPGSSIHYASAKGAVVTMTLGVAREFADRGIRCLSISPGPVRTAFQEAAKTSPELMERFKNDVPMKRFAEPEEIGELVLFMCSDACEYMTADSVYVNGGGGWR